MFTLQSLFLFLTIASFPLYLFPSGRPQVSHAFFVLFFLFFINTFRAEYRRIPPKTKAALRSLFIFVLITWLVQICYTFTLLAPRMMIFPVYFTFNTTYLLCVYLFLRRYRKKGATVVFFSIVTATLLVFGGYLANVSPVGLRQTSFFNNPNQLGYFAVIAMSIVLAYHTRATRWHTQLLAMGAVLIILYLSIISLSKAAMVATSVGMLLFLPSFKKSQLIVIGLIVLASFPIWSEKIMESKQFERTVKRLENIGKQDDDSFLARGYGQFLENPAYMLVTGAGEGEYHRFSTGNEVHSTFASVFFCYGIIGFGALMLFHYRCFRISPYLFFIIYFPSFAYGITHNGARFSYFWLLFAIYLWIAEEQERSDVRATQLPTDPSQPPPRRIPRPAFHR